MQVHEWQADLTTSGLGKCEVLNNVRLEKHGKTESKLTTANISVSLVFIADDIVDKVVIDTDFMIACDINFNMEQQIICWRNVNIPLSVANIVRLPKD